MHMLEEGYSINYIHERYGISHQLSNSQCIRLYLSLYLPNSYFFESKSIISGGVGKVFS